MVMQVGVPWQVLLTKCDLLDVRDLSKSIALTELMLLDALPIGSSCLWSSEGKEINESKTKMVDFPLVLPVSARTGVGVEDLWESIMHCVDETTMRYQTPPPSGAAAGDMKTDPRVREHISANLLREEAYRMQQEGSVTGRKNL
jgi:hypothetical protein